MTASDSPDLVLVTGTSSGLGAATAGRLLNAGYRVVGVARRDVAADSFGDGGRHYTHVRFDLGDIDGIPDLVSTLVKEHGTPYGLVNNAAIGNDGLLATMHRSDIEQVLDVDLLSPIILTKFVVRHQLAARRGRIVNVSSIVARTGYRGLSVYAAAKAGLEGFTRSLARDVGPRGITVNAVAPGFADTEMTATLGAENLEKIKRRSALGRFAAGDEIASAVEYLLSPAAAGITGTILTVDAGSTA
jgi:3-oxoacyl-[acyl-carrier protein] reductase